MMFSKSCQYALRAAFYLASNTRPGQNAGVKQIAESLDVPQQYLAKILQALVRNNLVSSLKGPHGGFFISRENLDVTLLQIVECIDGPLIFTACVMGLPACSASNPCPLHHKFFECRENFRDVLGSQKLKDTLTVK